MQYKVGDKVRVKEKCEPAYGIETMEQLQGKIVTISKVYHMDILGEGCFYNIKEDNEVYDWANDCFETTIQIGDIVTLRNQKQGVIIHYVDNQWLVRMFGSDACYYENFDTLTSAYKNRDLDIVRVEKYVENQKGNYDLIVVYERKEEILDKEEKEYLARIIEPLKDIKIDIVEKIDSTVGQSIKICYRAENEYGDLFGVTILPPFKTDTMYKGMEIGKEYTLKELGL